MSSNDTAYLIRMGEIELLAIDRDNVAYLWKQTGKFRTHLAVLTGQ